MYNGGDTWDIIEVLTSFVLVSIPIILYCLLLGIIIFTLYSATVYIPKRLNQIENRIKKLEKKEK